MSPGGPPADGELGLGDLVVGERGRITGLRRGDRSYREKLLAMGLTPGTEFSVTRLAPLGDPEAGPARRPPGSNTTTPSCPG